VDSFAAKINCDEKVDEVLNDLNDLRLENDKVAELCSYSASDPYNTDTAWRGHGMTGGDCEQTYGVINRLGHKVETRLEEACDAFNQGVGCTGASQQQQFSCSSSKYRLAGSKTREAVALLKKAQRILKRRIDHNRVDLNKYAALGGFDPDSVLGAQPSNITGDAVRYFKLGGEQARAMLSGTEFVTKSEPVADKLNHYQAKLNAMGATTAQRSQNLGDAGSTITGSLQKANAASQMGAGLADLGGQAMASGAPASKAASASGSFRDEDFLLKPGEGELSDEQFFNALNGKPLGVDLAARMPGEAGFEAGKMAGNENSKTSKALGEKQPGEADAAGGPANLSLDANGGSSENSQLLMADSATSGRGLASSGAKLGKGAGANDLTGASSPISGGRAKLGEVKESNEALANYAATSGKLKLLDRGGPSLRDMLRQKMSGGGASTRAMHEVLGGINELSSEEGGQRGESAGAGSFAEQGSNEDIKGIDSEPLFVRVRAAHLRYQKVHVGDSSI
jgi:hypothetical protein